MLIHDWLRGFPASRVNVEADSDHGPRSGVLIAGSHKPSTDVLQTLFDKRARRDLQLGRHSAEADFGSRKPIMRKRFTKRSRLTPSS